MAAAPLKRVMLSFQDDRLVMPVTSTTGKVSQLLADATVRFRAQRLLGKDDAFIQIRTSNGYLFNINDNIEDVIEQNDHLVLVNRAAWISEFKKQASPQYWFGIRQYDYTAKIKRDTSVSYSASRGALCLTFWKGDTTTFMEVFDRDTLTSYGKDGEILVLTDSGKQDKVSFEQHAYFKIEKGAVVAIRLVLRTFSDPQATIVEWPIKIGESDITYGEEKKIQRNWPAAPSKSYTLPPSVKTGKDLEAETEAPLRDLLADPNTSTGASPLIYTQTSQLSPEKYMDGRQTYQHFRVEFSVTNNSELDTHIARVAAEYQKADGTWAAFSTISRGWRQNDYNWNMGESATDPLRIDARGVLKFAVGCRLDLPAAGSLDSRGRYVLPTLPVPFNIRYTFTDQDQKSSTIVATLVRRGLHLPTLASSQKEDAGIQKFWYVDDHTTGERFTAIHYAKDTSNYVRIQAESSYYTIDSDALHTHTIHAVAEGTTERELTTYTREQYKGSLHLLIDLEAKYAYGVRVRLSSPDATLDESFLLPADKW